MYFKVLQRLVRFLACLVILKVTIGVVLNYADYLPPDFTSDFLQGRLAYFWNGYQVAFYLHIVSGPCALVVGTVQMSEWFRRRFPNWHRNLGRFHIVCTLLLVAPSGIWMAAYAETGSVAGLGFASLGIATAVCAWQGWRLAVRRRFLEHRQWMSRCFLLLCSAVVLRLIGGTFSIAGVEGAWTYPLAAWISWLGPLAAFELIRLAKKQSPASWSSTPATNRQ